ncbi:MAG TPA: fluoride efflux transporter CrcB [Gemmatimonadaceae bacterium]|jgi:crcB protein
MVGFIALGSAIGGVARFLLGTFVQARFGAGFPVGTLLVNISGAFLLGFIVTCALALPSVSPEMRGLLTTGFCGGYTTFSTFTYDTMALLEDGEVMRAAAYVALSVAIALLGVWLGIALGRGLIALRQPG